MSSSVWIINLVVLGVVLEADLGRRKITWPRLARPVIVAGAIVIYYPKRTPVATHGGGLAFELVLAAIGIVLGLAAGLIFMAVGMLLTRTATLRLRGAALSGGTSDAERAMPPAASWPADR